MFDLEKANSVAIGGLNEYFTISNFANFPHVKLDNFPNFQFCHEKRNPNFPKSIIQASPRIVSEKLGKLQIAKKSYTEAIFVFFCLYWAEWFVFDSS